MIEETMTSEEYLRMINATRRPGDDERTARNALRGRKSQVVGESFQDRLNAYHERLMETGNFLFILETKPPMRPKTQGRGKPPLYILLGAGPCDYVFAMGNGVSGSFDAKSTGEAKAFYWPRNRRHQLATLRELDRVSGGSAPAFALVEWRAYDEVRLHPITSIEGHAVRREHGIIVPDVLPHPDSPPFDAGPGWHEVVAEIGVY